MEFTMTEQAGIAVFALDGAVLGGPEATALKSELQRLLDGGGKKAVIDLSRVKLMNSSGLGLLIGSYTSLRNAGGELFLAAPNDNIRSLLAIAKLNNVFRIFAGVDEALAAFA